MPFSELLNPSWHDTWRAVCLQAVARLNVFGWETSCAGCTFPCVWCRPVVMLIQSGLTFSHIFVAQEDTESLLGPYWWISQKCLVTMWCGRGSWKIDRYWHSPGENLHMQQPFVWVSHSVPFCIDRSAENRIMMHKVYIFLIFMVLILPSLGLTR